jgi:hypothetical protein
LKVYLTVGVLFACTTSFSFLAKSAQQKQQLRLRIVLCDHAGVESGALTKARNVASRIMMNASVEIEWIDVGGGFKAGCDREDPFFEPSKWPAKGYYLVAIVPDVLPNSATTEVMGYAPVATGRYPRAYVFYNRIKRFSDLMEGMSSNSGGAIVLGHVMAHEMGHLLIPGDAHTKTGIMRAGWDYQQWKETAMGRLVFTESQAKQIRKQFHID